MQERTNLNKLQKIQNAAARIVTQSSRFSHSAPLLAELHWLPIKARINFKLATLTYKTLLYGQPAYFNNLITPYVPNRALRSASAAKLVIPLRKTSMANSKSFSSTAVSYWNSLLRSVSSASTLTNFRTLLKTHLFSGSGHY